MNNSNTLKLCSSILRKTVSPLLLAFTLTLTPVTASITKATSGFTSFPLPTGASPSFITTGPDGALWFVESNTNAIGRITTGGDIAHYPIPTPDSGANKIIAGPDGALWFTESNKSKIGRITTSGAITEYPAAPYSSSLTVGTDGALWFTEAKKIGRITTSGAITEYPIPNGYSDAGSITTGPDGALWFLTNNSNSGFASVGRMSYSGTATMYSIPRVPNTSIPNFAGRITTGPDGALWFSVRGYSSTGTEGNNRIGKISTDGTFTIYPLPADSLGNLGDITTGPDGALWFTERLGVSGALGTTSSSSSISRISTSGLFSRNIIQSASDPFAYGITSGPDNALWFTNIDSSGIGRFSPMSAPGAPQNLSSSTIVNHNPILEWSASPDATNYDIYRNGSLIGSTNNTTYTDEDATEGMLSYYVVAKNNIGISAPSNSINVLLDKTAPLITYTLTPSANTNGWNNSDVTATFTCNDSGSDIASCTNPITINEEAAGQTIIGTATDKAGNSSSISTASINIDKTAPIFGTPSWTSNEISSGENAVLSIPFSDTLSGVAKAEYYINADSESYGDFSFSSNNNTASMTFNNLPAGLNTISYKGLDKAGNWSSVRTTSIIVRPISPNGLSSKTPTNTAPVLDWASTADVDYFNIYRNGTLVGTSTSKSYTDTTAQDGRLDYAVTSVENGVESAPSSQVSVTLDRTVPIVAYATPLPNARGWYNSNVLITFTCSDPQTGIAYCSSPVSLTSDGANQYANGTATDKAGNSSSISTASINIDKTKPLASNPTMSGGLAGFYLFTTTTSIQATIGDILSGVVSAEYYFDSDPGLGNGHSMSISNSTATATGNLSGLNGQHTLYVRSQDAAGNWSDAASLSFSRLGL